MDRDTVRVLETLQAMKLRAMAEGSEQAVECYGEAIAALMRDVDRKRAAERAADEVKHATS